MIGGEINDWVIPSTTPSGIEVAKRFTRNRGDFDIPVPPQALKNWPDMFSDLPFVPGIL
jgi:hypothetical protein